MEKRFAVNRNWTLSPRYSLWLEHCKHQDDYENETPIGDEFDWSDCEECILRTTEDLMLSEYSSRDMCFNIWHEGVIHDEILNRK